MQDNPCSGVYVILCNLKIITNENGQGLLPTHLLLFVVKYYFTSTTDNTSSRNPHGANCAHATRDLLLQVLSKFW